MIQPNKPPKPPSLPYIAVSLLGDVVVTKPAEKPAFLFYSRILLPRYLLAPQTIRAYEIQGLAAECIHSWFAAELPFTFACESLDPVALSFRLATGLTIGVTDVVPPDPWPSYMEGLDLLITAKEAVRSKRPPTIDLPAHIAARHGEHPNADGIAATVLCFLRFHNSRQ